MLRPARTGARRTSRRAPTASPLVIRLAALASLFGTRVALAQPEPPSPPAPPEDTSSPAGEPPELPGSAADEPAPSPAPAKAAPARATANPAKQPVSANPPAPVSPPLPRASGGRFEFGSYGRVVASSDLRGGPGREADIVAFGSRLDETNYMELEFRREDEWAKTNSSTRIVATLAVAGPLFHYSGNFDADIAVRNLYLEEKGIGVKDLSVWAGSRMVRGDDIYLLNFWPLDNVNALGAGARYELPSLTTISAHGGLARPTTQYYLQFSERTPPFNQFGARTIAILERPRFVGSLKLSQIAPLSQKAGLKGVVYGELHALPEGQREVDPRVYETLPAEQGFVAGAQVGAFTGVRDTHVNLFLRYARGIAAYDSFATPTQLTFGDIGETTAGASELRVAASGNYEFGPFSVMLGGYVRSFRNASPALDFEDVDEGAVNVRPHFWIGEGGGLAVEGAYQRQMRGVAASPFVEEGAEPPDTAGPPRVDGLFSANLWRLGFIPFLSPAGRGSFSRPVLQLIWTMTFRDDAARSLYPEDDVFRRRPVEHFFGVAAEWWFNSSSYGG